MTRNRTTDKNIVFVGEHLHHLQTFHFHTVIAHAAGHTHTLEYAGRIGRTTNGTRRSLTVVLTVRSFTHTVEAMTFNNALEPLSFGSTNNTYLLTFSEDVYGNGVTNIFFCVIIAELFYKAFRRRLCLVEVIDFGFV